ncbi:MAG: hypothetical protein K2M73_08870, partial [Lachnospiraceae bacterium]|nr:hypothetical protein [Lachnospiraceae bacterium]
MYCPVCKAKLSDNAAICITCGTRLTDSLKEEAKKVVPEEPVKDTKKFKLFGKKEKTKEYSYNRALLDYADEKPGTIVARPVKKPEPASTASVSSTTNTSEKASLDALYGKKQEFSAQNGAGTTEYTVAIPKSEREKEAKRIAEEEARRKAEEEARLAA